MFADQAGNLHIIASDVLLNGVSVTTGFHNAWDAAKGAVNVGQQAWSALSIHARDVVFTAPTTPSPPSSSPPTPPTSLQGRECLHGRQCIRDVTARAHLVCNGQPSCSLFACNAMFGDACDEGESSGVVPPLFGQLEVAYQCASQLDTSTPSCTTTRACRHVTQCAARPHSACHAAELRLACQGGDAVRIVSATYGHRPNSTACPIACQALAATTTGSSNAGTSDSSTRASVGAAWDGATLELRARRVLWNGHPLRFETLAANAFRDGATANRMLSVSGAERNSSESSTSAAWCFDTAGQQWHTLPALPAPIVFAAATQRGDGAAFVSGGCSDVTCLHGQHDRATAAVHMLLFASGCSVASAGGSGVWVEGPSLNQPRFNHAMTSDFLDNIYVLGGVVLAGTAANSDDSSGGLHVEVLARGGGGGVWRPVGVRTATSFFGTALGALLLRTAANSSSSSNRDSSGTGVETIMRLSGPHVFAPGSSGATAADMRVAFPAATPAALDNHDHNQHHSHHQQLLHGQSQRVFSVVGRGSRDGDDSSNSSGSSSSLVVTVQRFNVTTRQWDEEQVLAGASWAVAAPPQLLQVGDAVFVVGGLSAGGEVEVPQSMRRIRFQGDEGGMWNTTSLPSRVKYGSAVCALA